jgi:cysteine desulfurase / selenocysteine lyase
MDVPRVNSPLDVQALRADFPILGTILDTPRHHGMPLVYLDSAATTPAPRRVIQAMVATCERYYANVHRGTYWLAEQATELYEGAREKVKTFLNAPSAKQVVFTSGTTQAINLVARSWGDANLRSGEEILVSEMEHHSNIVPWQQLARRTGAVVRYIPIAEDGRLNLTALDQMLGGRTRLVAVTGVSNVLGTVNPLHEVIRRVHDAGAIVLLDAAQGVGHEPTDVAALDVDFLAFSGHKMFAPSGVGVLYGRQALLEAMPPFLGGGGMIRNVTLDGFEAAESPAKFEAGTPPIVPVIGLGAAIEYLETIGMEVIAAYERQLTERAQRVLESVDGVQILGPRPQWKRAIFSFTVKGIHADDVARLLDRQGIAVRAGHHCAMPLHQHYGVTATTRASFAIYNTPAEIDRLGAALEQLQQAFRRRK